MAHKKGNVCFTMPYFKMSLKRGGTLPQGWWKSLKTVVKDSWVNKVISPDFNIVLQQIIDWALYKDHLLNVMHSFNFMRRSLVGSLWMRNFSYDFLFLTRFHERLTWCRRTFDKRYETGKHWGNSSPRAQSISKCYMNCWMNVQ